MRFFAPVLIALGLSSTASAEAEFLVELINATDPVNHGVAPGTSFVEGSAVMQPVGPPPGAGGTRRRAKDVSDVEGVKIEVPYYAPPAPSPGGERRDLEEAFLVEQLEASDSVNHGVEGAFVEGSAIGTPVAPLSPASSPGGERRDLAQDLDLVVSSVELLNADVPEHQRRKLCGYGVFMERTCYAAYEEVVAIIDTCGTSSNQNAEWAGVYTQGAAVWPPLNWHYLCGGQSCARPVAAGRYRIGFTLATRTVTSSPSYTGPWPLPQGVNLQVYFHTGAIGSLQSNIFSVGYGTGCGSNPTPTPPSPTPRPVAPTPSPIAPSPTCSHSISTQNCWGLGQTIQFTVNTCSSTANPEWMGIYYAGTTNFAAALNWGYIYNGGQQRYAREVGPGSYAVTMDASTQGSRRWPLPPGTYQAYFHSGGSGSYASNTFQITSTNSCSPSPSPPTTPTTPSASRPSSTSAPATTSGSGSSSPVGTLYVPASAADCNAVRTGQIVVGSSAMRSSTFYFIFALGVNGQTLSTSQIASIVTTAFQSLIGTSLLNCSARRLLRKPIERFLNRQHSSNNSNNHHHKHKHHKHHNKHHHHHERRLEQVANFHRRLELDENVIGDVRFITECAAKEFCSPMETSCFECTTTIEVYLKGPADPADIEAAIQAIIDSPTFFEDLGLITDILYLQQSEDLILETASPTSGPTEGPTPSPTSVPTEGPTGRPTTGPTSNPTAGPTSAPTSSPTSVPTDGPTGRPTTGPTSIPTSGPTTGDDFPDGPPFDDLPPTSGPTAGPTYGGGGESGPSIPTPTTPTGPTPTEPTGPTAPSPTTPTGPTPTDTPPTDTPRDPGSKGDPHFKTWQNEHFEYHGQCDIVLAKDPNFANGLGLDVHIRTKLIRFWSYIQSAVIRIGTDILEIQGKPGAFESEIHYWINYEYQGELTEFAGFPVTLIPYRTRIDIDLSSLYPGQVISLSAFKEFVKVSFGDSSEEAFGNTVGILGNFKTGETLSRDGVTVLDDFTELGQEWQVMPSDGHLFRETSHPQFPDTCLEPDDPRGDRMRRLDESSVTEEQAEAACAQLKDEFDRKDCIYDILATQDMDMAGAY